MEWKRYPYRCIIKLCEVIGNGCQFAVALQKGVSYTVNTRRGVNKGTGFVCEASRITEAAARKKTK